jgi:tetratricopeptide (TPR) repeat protein
MANVAACSIFLGKIKAARDIYLSLLQKKPLHQRNHYQLSRLERATDNNHIEQMKAVLNQTNLPAHRNIFIYYALAKELEDQEQWDESFHYYKKAGDAVTTVSNYDVSIDETIIQKIMDTCTAEWLADRKMSSTLERNDKSPIFVLGLPRTGTTLTERILASHSSVESIGETKYLESIMRTLSGIPSVEKMTPEMIDALAPMDTTAIAKGYLDAVSYLFGDKDLFIEKLPYNFLYIGFIVKAFPNAKIVRLKCNPMDSCFAIYKQPFTWAYKFSYNLD